MYDIKIFLEDNGEFGARVNAGKEVIYGTGTNNIELMNDIKQGLELSFENKTKSSNVSRLFNYINDSDKNLICH